MSMKSFASVIIEGTKISGTYVALSTPDDDANVLNFKVFRATNKEDLSVSWRTKTCHFIPLLPD